jgi:hypothetical protein
MIGRLRCHRSVLYLKNFKRERAPSVANTDKSTQPPVGEVKRQDKFAIKHSPCWH